MPTNSNFKYIPSLKNWFEENISDCRRLDKGNIKHALANILIIAFCAIMGGCTSFEMIRAFAESFEEDFTRLLNLTHGLPSKDTFRRAFAQINPQELRATFNAWAQVEDLPIRIIAFDGKTIRCSKHQDMKAAHIVTFFSPEQLVSIDEIQVQEKSNEISAVNEMLDRMARNGKIEGLAFTADAMSCQRNICSKITDNGGSFVFSLKENQKTLYQDVKLYFDGDSSYESIEIALGNKHGRPGMVIYSYTTDIDFLQYHNWPGLKGIGCVTTITKKDGKNVVSTLYYIGSVDNVAEFYTIRSKYWSIENNLHWNLDECYNEDRSRTRTQNGAQNINIFRKTVLFFIEKGKILQTQLKKLSKMTIIFKCGQSLTFIESILNSYFIQLKELSCK